MTEHEIREIANVVAERVVESARATDRQIDILSKTLDNFVVKNEEEHKTLMVKLDDGQLKFESHSVSIAEIKGCVTTLEAKLEGKTGALKQDINGNAKVQAAGMAPIRLLVYGVVGLMANTAITLLLFRVFGIGK